MTVLPPAAPPDPPWFIFADRGKSIAVLPAGRPGEVADVRFVPDAIVARLVENANRQPALAHQIARELVAMNTSMDGFPRGKISADDQGAVAVAFTVKDGTVILDFHKSLTWIGLGADDARAWGKKLLELADQIEH